ncbi:aromatic-ring-hydroxylating dioxygenase subunit beta [Sphingomonas oryzagri]
MDNKKLEAARILVLKEGWLLDRQDWDAWLDLYSPSAEYWLPCWREDETLTNDPQRQISLIYYPSRTGLEDRVFRIKTERSLASTPLPRTCHMTSIVHWSEGADGAIEIESNWVVYSYRLDQESRFFGNQIHVLKDEHDELKIVRRKIVVLNDTIQCPLDVYSV